MLEDSTSRVACTEGGTSCVCLSMPLDSGPERTEVDRAEPECSVTETPTDLRHHRMITTSTSPEPEGQEEEEEAEEEEGEYDEEGGGHSPHRNVASDQTSGSLSPTQDPSTLPSSDPADCDLQSASAAPTPLIADEVISPSEPVLSAGHDDTTQNFHDTGTGEQITVGSACQGLLSHADNMISASREGVTPQSSGKLPSPPRQTASILSPTSESGSPVATLANTFGGASSVPISPILPPSRPLPVQVEEVSETPQDVPLSLSDPSPSDTSKSESSAEPAISMAERNALFSTSSGKEVSPALPTLTGLDSPASEASKVDMPSSPQLIANDLKSQGLSRPSMPAEEAANASLSAQKLDTRRPKTGGSGAVGVNEIPESQSNSSRSLQMRQQTPELDTEVDESDDDVRLLSPLHGRGKRKPGLNTNINDSGDDADLSSSARRKGNVTNSCNTKTSSWRTPSKNKRGQSPTAKRQNNRRAPKTGRSVEDAIRLSYTEAGYDGDALRVSYDRTGRHPTTLNLTFGTAKQSELTKARLQKMHREREELLAFLPVGTECAPKKTDIDLVLRLSQKPIAPIQKCSFVEAAAACEQRTRLSSDEINLWRFLQSLALVAASRYDSNEVRKLKAWNGQLMLMPYSSNELSATGTSKSGQTYTCTNACTSS